MSELIAPLFLAQSYQDAQADYERARNREDFARWDYIILTASNEHQAEGFRAQLEQRRKDHFLPEGTHFAVVSDPDGKRVGSGLPSEPGGRPLLYREKCSIWQTSQA